MLKFESTNIEFIAGYFMKHFTTRLRFIIATIILLVSSSCSDMESKIDPNNYQSILSNNEPLPEQGINILFIGNSLTYSNDLPGILQRMLILADVEVGKIESQSLGGYGLPDHWQRHITRERLAVSGWDIVILQQGPSATEGRPYLLEYTPLFDSEIKQSGGQTALYMVWPAKARFFDFAGVSDSYASAARLVDGLLYPVGEAWLAAWRQDPSIALYGADNFHPGLLGTYLAALTMFEQISGKDLNDLPPVIPAASGDVTIDTATARILQHAAKEANLNFALYPGQ